MEQYQKEYWKELDRLWLDNIKGGQTPDIVYMNKDTWQKYYDSLPDMKLLRVGECRKHFLYMTSIVVIDENSKVPIHLGDYKLND